jgi:angio-associated migratory cell protein
MYIHPGGGDDRAFLWKYPETPGSTEAESCFELTGHSDTVSSVGFNYDGTLALTGSYDGTIRIWNVETGELKIVLDGPEDIEFAEWHVKGNAVVAGSKDGTIWMWLTHNGQCVQVFAGHDGGVACGCYSKDGTTVCSGGEDGTIRLWAPLTGKCKHVFEGHFGHEGPVTCIASGGEGADLLLTGRSFLMCHFTSKTSHAVSWKGLLDQNSRVGLT